MSKHNTNTSRELLSLLRQQRYLYHQLKILTDKQQQLTAANSPESILEIVFGRRKLIEKIQESNGKLRLVQANWQKISGQIDVECKIKAGDLASQIQKTIEEIPPDVLPGTAQNPSLYEGLKFDELPVEAGV